MSPQSTPVTHLDVDRRESTIPEGPQAERQSTERRKQQCPQAGPAGPLGPGPLILSRILEVPMSSAYFLTETSVLPLFVSFRDFSAADTSQSRCSCPGNISAPNRCPAGTFNLYTGKSSVSDCKGVIAQTAACPSRSPVLQDGHPHLDRLTAADVTKRPLYVGELRPPSAYHYTGLVNPSPVDQERQYCVGGVALFCPAGTYGSNEGLQRLRDCAICPAGFYCLEGSSQRPTSQFLCPQGYYCEEGTATPHGSPCPAGTAGKELGQTSRAACKRCREGRFCPAGVKDCLKCPVGFYCPEGTSDPMPCPPGSFNPLEGQDELTDCRQCYAGRACTQIALRAPDVDCMQGPNAPTNACPPGTLGNRTDLTDRSQCQQCPARYACLRGTGGIQRPPLSCFAGHYCPRGTMFPTQYKCPVGTWSSQSGLEAESECQPCPRGWYCLAGSAAPTGRCNSGYYCPEATVNPRVCGAGSYSVMPHPTQSTDEGSEECSPCLQGHYCSNETTSEEAMRSLMGLARDPQRSATLCPRGFYCPGGSINPNPVPCPNGTYGESPGLRDVSECVQCPEGKYCYSLDPQEQPITRPTEVCPDGHYCPPGTGDPYTYPCQAGTYRNNTFGHSGEACISCPSRHYCNRLGTPVPLLCPPGSYCPDGTSTPRACPEGTYGSRSALSDVSECTPCGGGQYCTGVGLVEPSGSCRERFYCTVGAKSPILDQLEVCVHQEVTVPWLPAPPTPAPLAPSATALVLAALMSVLAVHQDFTVQVPTAPHLLDLVFLVFTVRVAQHHLFSMKQRRVFTPWREQPGQSHVLLAFFSRVAVQRHVLNVKQEDCATKQACPSHCNVLQDTTVLQALQWLIPVPLSVSYPLICHGAEGVEHCRPCEAGSFCYRAGLSEPEGLCDPGHYCTSGASTASPVAVASGGVCPRGYICPKGTKHPQQHPCPVGTWSSSLGAQNVTSCLPCPPGLYCNSTGLSQPSGLCDNGYYCSKGAGLSKPTDDVTGNICPVGHYCPKGSAFPILCPDGTYTNTTGAEMCDHCPSGTYCLSGEGVQPCPAGHYCLGGGVEGILPCPPGTYSPRLGLSQVEQCLICPAGYYCEDWGLFEPSGPCLAGYYCMAGVNFENPDGNFSTGIGGACPPGRYCPEGTGLPLPCPAGTFSDSLYLADASGCSRCPAGQYCGTAGLIQPSGLCQAGSYCPGGDTTRTGSEGGLCPSSFYCPEGSAMPVPCPAGTYTNLAGQPGCSRCPAGYYCPEKTGNFSIFPCPPGFYCPDGTLTQSTPVLSIIFFFLHHIIFPCPRGYYNPEPMTQSLDSCLPCPPGHYCEKERLTKVSGKCKAGLALPVGPCSPGYYCTGGATGAKPVDGETGNICPPGTYCAEGSAEPELCPAGTFSPVYGLTNETGCQPCTAGSYCREAGLRAPTGPCSQEGSSAPEPCPSGTSQNRDKQSSCTVCEAGYYCDARLRPVNASIRRPCPKGHYCPAGTGLPNEHPCPIGSFNPGEGTDSPEGCIPCNAGHYCPYIGMSEPAGTTAPEVCPKGSWSNSSGLQSREHCTPCPGGYYCDSVGLTKPNGICNKGYYCLEGAVTSTPTDGITGGPCPGGHYCPEGTAQPLPCEPGTYTTVTHASQCELCMPGWYCVSGSLYLCAAGFYCPGGTGFDLRGCPEGTYGPGPGYWSVSQCRPCDGGHYCSFRNGTSVTGPCQEGYYCSYGNISPQPFLQAAGEGGPCPAGHYCPMATTHPLPCPRGTFSNLSKLVSQEDCQPCLPGYYCDDLGLSAPSGKCREGFFCLGGADRSDPPVRDNRGGPCPKGYYCSEGSVAPQHCPLGTISTEDGQASCSACPQGNNASLSESYECPVGHYCPPRTWSKHQYPCPAGSFNPHTQKTKSQDCLPCPPGFYCDSPGKNVASGLCSAGYYCLSGAQSPTPEDGRLTGDRCPEGHYCPQGSSAPQPCPIGYHTNKTRNSHLSDCLPCPPGFLCVSRGLSFPSHVCPAGSYCPGRDNTSGEVSIACSPGNECPPGSYRQIPCLPGTYQSLPGQGRRLVLHSHAQLALSAGRWGYPISRTVSPAPRVGIAVLQGWLLPLESALLVTFVSRVLFLPNQRRAQQDDAALQGPTAHRVPDTWFPALRARAVSIEVCQPCLPGYYCANGGLSSPSGPCSPGFYCRSGSKTATPLGNVTGNRTLILFMDETWHLQPHLLAIQPWVISMEMYVLQATIALKGVRNQVPVLQVNTVLSIHTDTGYQCPPGHACPPGSAEPAMCRAGTFQSLSGQDTCDSCPSGFYCEEGSSMPSPCSVGHFNQLTGRMSLDDCFPCPSGFFCNNTALTDPSGPCSPGHFCSLGSTEPSPVSQSYGDICPMGHFCPEGSGSPRPCPVGSYLPEPGAFSLSNCQPCPPGKYCHKPGASQPSGFFCSGGSHSPTPQANSTLFSCLLEIPDLSTMMSDPIFCFSYCGISESDASGIKVAPVPQADSDHNVFIVLWDLLIPNHVKLAFTVTRLVLMPHQGPVQQGITVLGVLQTLILPLAPLDTTALQGLYSLCPALSEPYKVPLVESELRLVSLVLQVTIATREGYLSQVVSVQKATTVLWDRFPKHQNNIYALWDISVRRQTPCPPGSYQFRQGQGICEQCPAGFYCQDQGMSLPIPCERGFYCPSGSAFQRPCPSGTYGNMSKLTEELQCTPCDPGMYCKGTGSTLPSGLCSAGFVCLGGAYEPSPSDSLTGYICPPGFFCPEGGFVPKPCPKGTFSEQSGLVEDSQCQSCKSGFYCSESGLSTVSGPCLPGFYCLGGSQSATPAAGASGGICPAGHYCTKGSSVPTPCPAGFYQNEEGGKGKDDCKPCFLGWFQNLPGQKECDPCPAGYHCQSLSTSPTRGNPTGASSPVPCPAGFVCPKNDSTSQLIPCPKGTYNPSQGLTHTAGHFCGTEGLVEPTGLCAAGFLCMIGAKVPNPTDNKTGSLCPRGMFCQQGLQTGDCQAGFYCGWGSRRANQTLCPAGFFCPSGTPDPIPCPAGTFSPETGNIHQDNCIPCTPGYYCRDEGTFRPSVCPVGHFCPAGQILGFKFPCPPATVQSQLGASSADACHPCPVGMFCSRSGLSQPSGHCQAGYFCPAGSTSPNSTEIQGNLARTHLCPSGYYCPSGTGYPLPCPVGSLSMFQGLRSIEECAPCPPGLFCNSTAMAKISDALPCQAGYVCLGGSSSPTPFDGSHGYPCPAGYSCPVGSASEVPCEPGTYSSGPGASRCVICLKGTMCPSTATKEPVTCPAGHFCPAGTALPQPCPLGTFSNQTGAHSLSDCTSCPPGLYCSSYGASTPEGPCLQGYFCQGGSKQPTPERSDGFPKNGPCPVGHFCPRGCLSPILCPIGSIRNTTGGVSIESCFACPAGHYCSSEGLSSPSGPCAAGFYCPYDFSSTTPYAFLCPKGHFCPEGSSLALPCPTGEYQPNPGSESCIPCRPGFYCEEAIVGDPWPCPPYSFCPAGTMVPQPCPKGTYSTPNRRGLQNERECLPCPPGKFCRAGKIQGACAAGYLCVSGSADFTPQGPVSQLDSCQWGAQCAAPCPPGTELAQLCPANTIRSSPGALSQMDCLPCPPQYWCKAGDPVLHLCPAGHYCDGLPGSDFNGGTGPRPCPLYKYRASPGARSKGDCLPCPPGSLCNSTGLTDYFSSPCPPGFWCSGSGPPILCPAGTMRQLPGASAPNQCEPCAGGTFCPDPHTTGKPNVEGIPCRASYQCPVGAVSEKLCRAGSYCGPQTAEPKICPEGYFCPEGSSTYSNPKQLCPYPYYCSANSSILKSCDGGSRPVNTSGLRGSKHSCCSLCEGGTYRQYLSPIFQCLPCPPGYYCPPGTDDYKSNVCPVGHVCPKGSAQALSCPPGTFGNHPHAGTMDDCHPCPANTFNHLPAQKACFPCGSSSTSPAGSSSCVCIGKNRAFQHSDGSCLCRTGFIFYNELDFKSSTADSEFDCQPEVNKRCTPGQVRLAASRECVSPSLHSCNITCGPHGGTLDVEMGICQCERYVSAEELCNTSCLSRLPQLSAQLSPDGNLLLSLKNPDSMSWARTVTNVLSPDIHAKISGKIHLVQFDSGGVFGWIPTQKDLINQFLSEPTEILNTRRKRGTKGDGAVTVLPRIPNPIACLSSGDMVVFHLTINHTDRRLSHFPVYQKDHLFNSNPSWDFGAFRRLQILMSQTNFNSTRFAHIFSETGKYVFVDNAVPEWSLVLVVSGEGTECDPRAAVFQPMTPAHLVKFGIVKQHRLNLLPDWGVITGILALLLVAVIVLTTTVLVLRPGKAKLVTQWKLKPKWRSLGEPFCPVECVCNGESKMVESRGGDLGNRGVGEGAEAEEPLILRGGSVSGCCDLEEFNVRTLFDKLEDQNLHIATQLARHRKDMQEFYRNICHQAESLKNVFESMDTEKLSLFKEIMVHNAAKDKLSHTSVGEGDVQAPAFMSLLGAVLRSVEALLCRLTGDTWQNQDLPGAPYCQVGPHDARDCETQAGCMHPSHTNMCFTQVHSDIEYAQSAVPSLSDHDLSKLVTMSPLFKTLQEIQRSLRNNTTNESHQHQHNASTEHSFKGNHDGQLIPTALDNLSPQHSAVFLFGCQVMRLLGNCPEFPSVLLLLAKSIPIPPPPSNEGPLPHCSGDFYFDATNQILYLSEAKLQHVGNFIAVILQSMAHVAAGPEPQKVMQALHEAVSALSLQLFNLSFKRSTGESNFSPLDGLHGTLVDEFLNIRVPSEAHFTEQLLASRLKNYKYFKLAQLISDLKQSSADTEIGLPLKGTPVQMSCVEEEIDRISESFLQLTMQIQRRAQMSTWRNEGENSVENQRPITSSTSMPSLSRNGTILLELKRRHVSQRLNELQVTLGQMRQCQQHDSASTAATKGGTQSDSRTARQEEKDQYLSGNGCSPADGHRTYSVSASPNNSHHSIESRGL
ncbi:unnamed protein product, partial [Menidia menidia]